MPTWQFFPIIGIGLLIGLSILPQLELLVTVWEGMIIAWALGILTMFIVLVLLMPTVTLLIGKLWRGNAEWTQLVQVYCISFTPMTMLIPVKISMLLLGEAEYKELGYLLYLITWFWSMALLITGISKVQKFRHGLTLLNILFIYLIILLMKEYFL